MARKKKCKVFVSYSRHDETLIRPLAGLLGAATDDAVFLDVESIKPGDLWKTEIEEALKQASVFILCWCCESNKSEFIAYEVEKALESRGKKLVPVLLCSMPLPNRLQGWQWINLQGRIMHSCGDHALVKVQPAAMVAVAPARMAAPTSRWAIGIAAGVLLLVAGLSVMNRLPGRHSAAPPEIVGEVRTPAPIATPGSSPSVESRPTQHKKSRPPESGRAELPSVAPSGSTSSTSGHSTHDLSDRLKKMWNQHLGLLGIIGTVLAMLLSIRMLTLLRRRSAEKIASLAARYFESLRQEK